MGPWRGLNVFCAIIMLLDQARNSTIDVEVENIDGLQTTLRELRDRWDDVYSEAKQVALAMGIDVKNHHGLEGIRRRLGEITADIYRINVYYKAIDSVLVGLSVRYQAMYEISSTSNFCSHTIK